jgi:hypothetical protein
MTRLVFKFLGTPKFYNAKSLFIAVNASLRSLIKVDWLDACIALRVVGAVLVFFLQLWRKICTIPQPMGSKGRYLKKISQTLLTNKNQGNLDKVHATNIIKPTQTRINREKYTLYVIKSLELLKNYKLAAYPI